MSAISQLVFRSHAIRRMFQRGVTVADIDHIIDTGEVIEDRPDDLPYPSRLVLGSISGRALRGPLTMVVRHVPAQICDNCGEEYIDEAATQKALTQAETAARQGVTVEVREFEAA